MKHRPSSKQRRYAYNIMNTDTTKETAALSAGYSPSMARVPQVIESSRGFNLAMAGIASQAGSLAASIMHTLQARDLTKEDTKTLTYSLDIISKAFERFNPVKNTKDNEVDKEINAVFSRVIDITPSETVDAQA